MRKYLTAAVLSLALTACGPGHVEWNDAGTDGGWSDSDTGPTCDPSVRRTMIEFECLASGCHGRWECSDEWSHVAHVAEIDPLARVDSTSVWECTPTPDVDACVVIDGSGHIGCFRYDGPWAVAVAPSCAIGPSVDWLDAGVGMVANIH